MADLSEHLALNSLRYLRGYRSRYVATSVGRLHVLERRARRSGPSIVLVHGLSAGAVHFYPLLRHLHDAADRVIAPDLPGHGFSEPPRRLDAASLQAGLIELLDALVDRPVLMVGVSLGGYAALRYALARPERLSGLVLTSPVGAEMTPEEIAWQRKMFQPRTHREALAFIDLLFSRPNRFRHVLAWGLRRRFRRPEVSAILDAAGPDVFFRPEELGALSPPTLLVWGKEERILPTRHLEYYRTHLPAHVRFETPSGFGHSAYLDDSQRLAQFIRGFHGELMRRGASVGER